MMMMVMMMFAPCGVDVFLIIKEVIYIYLSFILGRFVFLTFLQRGGKHMKPPLSDGVSAFSSRMSRLDLWERAFFPRSYFGPCAQALTVQNKSITTAMIYLSIFIVCNQFFWFWVCAQKVHLQHEVQVLFWYVFYFKLHGKLERLITSTFYCQCMQVGSKTCHFVVVVHFCWAALMSLTGSCPGHQGWERRSLDKKGRGGAVF